MNRELLVYVDGPAGPQLCGRLWSRAPPRPSATFEYAAGWLSAKGGFALEPELPLVRGPLHSEAPLFRVFRDAAPDRWGQTLLRRAERARAKRAGQTPKTLSEQDFLVLVADETRLGALRLRDAASPEGPFLSSDGRAIPPLLSLPALLGATERFVADEETEEDLALVLAPGTSLGGARPKASVRGPGGRLLIAKFPRRDDPWPLTRWEAVALTLAEKAGIRVPRFELRLVARRPVLLLERFDRSAGLRLPFMSGMTAVSADDNAPRSYLDLLDALRQLSGRVKENVEELWRRMVFNVLVSNTDDHLRNHGLLRSEEGWRLAPAYDLNPVPVDVRPRVHALALDEADATGSLGTVLAVAPRFGLKPQEARRITREVGRAVKGWRKAAAGLGLKPAEVERMESAFEHDDLAQALK